MYLYEFVFVTLIILYSFEAKLSTKDAAVDKVPKDIKEITFYFTFNNTSTDDYYVKVLLGDCHLIGEMGSNLTDEICKSTLPAGQTRTIKLKAAYRESLARDDQYLMCWIYVHLKTYYQNSTREIITVKFHVSLLEGNSKTEIITIDCDNFNSSQPGECEKIHRKDRKYRESTTKSCINVPSFLDSDKIRSTHLTNLLTTRVIIKRDTLERSVKSEQLFNDNHESRKDMRVINTTALFDLSNTVDVCPQTTEKHIKMKHEKIIHTKSFRLDKSLYKYLKQYIWITALLAAITIIQCILIFTICMRRKCQCFGEKRVISHFFRTYQQDSVTTPLMSTSGIDVESSKHQSASDSSMLKCYQSCEKDKSENTKISKSDDILSKFINRREWKNHYKYSDENESKDENQKSQIPEIHSKHKNFNENISKDINDLGESKCVVESGDTRGDAMYSSDKQVDDQCFSCYNTQVDSGSTFETKNLNTNESKSSEKAAQTYFSKDSIDAILSERNIYLADENLSKYTLSSASGKNKSTELLNKASKNIAKYFNTLLHKRSRQSSQSEPGKDKDLTLLHMSEASLYSSNDSE